MLLAPTLVIPMTIKRLIRVGACLFLAGLSGTAALTGASAQTATPTPRVTGSQPEPGCYDFNSQEEAQEFYEDEGGPDEDPHNLDSDGDGIACEGMSEVAVGAAFGIVLAQAATPTPTPTPTGSASPTPTGSASPTPTASSVASPTASASATPIPVASALPKTGGAAYVLAIVALCLVLSGLFLVGFAQARRLVTAPVAKRDARPRYDEYDLLGF